MDSKEFNFEKLKMVYDQVAEHHRYFLSWRQYLLAGSFAVFASLFYSSYVLFEKGGNFTFLSALLLIANALLSKMFLQLDCRNRILYRSCQRIGKKIEEALLTDKTLDNSFPFKLVKESKDNVALFFTLRNSIYHKEDKEITDKENKEMTISHSSVFDLFYNTVFYFSLSSGILIIYIKFLTIILGFFK